MYTQQRTLAEPAASAQRQHGYRHSINITAYRHALTILSTAHHDMMTATKRCTSLPASSMSCAISHAGHAFCRIFSPERLMIVNSMGRDFSPEVVDYGFITTCLIGWISRCMYLTELCRIIYISGHNFLISRQHHLPVIMMSRGLHAISSHCLFIICRRLYRLK